MCDVKVKRRCYNLQINYTGYLMFVTLTPSQPCHIMYLASQMSLVVNVLFLFFILPHSWPFYLLCSMQQRIRNYHSQAGVKATAKGRKYTDKICLTLGSAIIFNLVENRRQQFSVTIISTSFQLTSCLKALLIDMQCVV